jgi:hypothetical protein
VADLMRTELEESDKDCPSGSDRNALADQSITVQVDLIRNILVSLIRKTLVDLG